MNIATLGIDLAKPSFALHGVDSSGKVLLKKNVSRKKLTETLINLPPCLIGMEGYASAHYWARVLKQFGHDVKLMPTQFVKSYVKSNKDDCSDVTQQFYESYKSCD